jgi:fructose 1,6-bisphosphatase
MRIVLALDESRYAETIAKWMTRFPHPMNTRLTLLQVLERSSRYGPLMRVLIKQVTPTRFDGPPRAACDGF